jgi:hypothetical protein
MSFNRYMSINGVCLSLIEPIDPDIPFIPLGIAATRIPNAIRVKLTYKTNCDGIPLVCVGLDIIFKTNKKLIVFIPLLTDHIDCQFL